MDIESSQPNRWEVPTQAYPAIVTHLLGSLSPGPRGVIGISDLESTESSYTVAQLSSGSRGDMHLALLMFLCSGTK
jgi:hypothetical protein